MAAQLNVSIDTIRRDVKELDKKQLIKKVHGGAISLGFVSNNAAVDVYDVNEKQSIAQKSNSLHFRGCCDFYRWGNHLHGTRKTDSTKNENHLLYFEFADCKRNGQETKC